MNLRKNLDTTLQNFTSDKTGKYIYELYKTLI